MSIDQDLFTVSVQIDNNQMFTLADIGLKWEHVFILPVLYPPKVMENSEIDCETSEEERSSPPPFRSSQL